MKMIIAINNEVIEEKLICSYSKMYSILNLKTKEEIIQMISSQEEFLIITREDLKGNVELFDLIEEIRTKNNNNRLVIIVRRLTKELKEKLFSKEVFNIIEGNSFLFDELIENIETPKMVIYKSKEEIRCNSKVIIITGTRCCGKTVFAKFLSENIAKNKSKKILVLDLDFVYPALDTYLYVDKNNSLIDFLKDLINHNIKRIETYETNNIKYKNLKYILNSKSIGIPNEEILIEMLNVLKNFYDYIIVDTSTLMLNKIYSISKKLNCQIIYLLEENIKSLREYILDSKSVDKNLLINTKFVINKSQNNKDVIKKIEEILPVKASLVIPNYTFIGLIIKNNIRISKINKILKLIGIMRFENLKLKIIEKILNMKEE